eukprot:TRINITY_DN6966_c0_g1_i4.p2 TRINITY_DN6966_c0_g1~~TRINITY_DN6966_c0_g1_i4.p2  ORF type:complete len:222 (-),score=19.43 TRINITY_DN6966_c0_g1_i4:43-708(-)
MSLQTKKSLLSLQFCRSKGVRSCKSYGQKLVYRKNTRIIHTLDFRCKVVKAEDLGYNLYKELGVDQNASQQEIKKSFKRLALKFHPDINPAPDAQRKFMRVKQAYEILTDPKARAQYDRTLSCFDVSGFEFNDFNFQGSDSNSRQTYSQPDEEFYGLEDLLRDISIEFESWLDRIKREQIDLQGLWQNFADLQEEFMQYLENEWVSKEEVEQTVEQANPGN